MTDIINLKDHRKARTRDEKEKTAMQNRRKFGRTKVEKLNEKQQSEQAKKLLDAHKMDKADKDDDE